MSTNSQGYLSDEDEIKRLRAENGRLQDAMREIIRREEKAWMPMRVFRSEYDAALDDARHEAWTAAADIARSVLDQQ